MGGQSCLLKQAELGVDEPRFELSVARSYCHYLRVKLTDAAAEFGDPIAVNAHDRSFILTLSCRDTVGIVAAVTNKLAEHSALITEAQPPACHGSLLRSPLCDMTAGSAST